MEEFLILIPKMIWLMLPAGVANMSPVLIQNHLMAIAKPVDGGRTLGGKPLFGDHKTWRGLFVATLSGGLFFLAQLGLTSAIPQIADWPYADIRLLPWSFGFVIGAGAILGDLMKSFFKRRVRVSPGKSWFPFDQLDYVIGGALLGSIWVDFSWQAWIIIIFIGPILHIVVNHLAYWLHIRNEAW